jgi:hypothetical protein
MLIIGHAYNEFLLYTYFVSPVIVFINLASILATEFYLPITQP